MERQNKATGITPLGGLELIADNVTQQKEKARLEKGVKSRDERIEQLEQDVAHYSRRCSALEAEARRSSSRMAQLEEDTDALKAKIQEMEQKQQIYGLMRVWQTLIALFLKLPFFANSLVLGRTFCLALA